MTRLTIMPWRPSTLIAQVKGTGRLLEPHSHSRVLDDLAPAACHIIDQYANDPIEADHSRLKAQLRPMRGLKTLRSARVVSAGHAFIQNLRRGHYELGADVDPRYQLPVVFTGLALTIRIGYLSRYICLPAS